jgi:hypothetical protein
MTLVEKRALIWPSRLAQHRSKPRKRSRWPVILFLIGLIVPWAVFLGDLRLSVYRIVLLIVLIPCLGMWIAGKAGRIRLGDIALLLFALWCPLSLMVLHGIERSLQTSGIIFVETLGPYMLARCCVRDADDFYNIVRALFGISLLLLPFAFFEFITGANISQVLFAAILPVPAASYTPMPSRLGLTRVTSVFDHPILFGIFTGITLGLVHLVLGYRRNLVDRTLRSSIVAGTGFLSLSSGPLVAIAVQGFLLSWDSLFGSMRIRWILLIGLIAVAYMLAEIFANRPVASIVIGYLLFDDGSYWFRLMIWEYGWATVLQNPLLGIGLNEWERPIWMGNSIDNFWLFLAVRHGLPGVGLVFLAFFWIFLAVAFKRGLDQRSSNYRAGFLISMAGFFVVAWTVALWNAAYVLFPFLMGCGSWFLEKARVPRASGPAGRALR